MSPYYDDLVAQKLAREAAAAAAEANKIANAEAFAAAKERELALAAVRGPLIEAVMKDLLDNAGVETSTITGIPDWLVGSWIGIAPDLAVMPTTWWSIRSFDAQGLASGRKLWAVTTLMFGVLVDEEPKPDGSAIWVDEVGTRVEVRLVVSAYDPRQSIANATVTPIVLPFVSLRPEAEVTDEELREAFAAAYVMGEAWVATTTSALTDGKPYNMEHPAYMSAKDQLQASYTPYREANMVLLS